MLSLIENSAGLPKTPNSSRFMWKSSIISTNVTQTGEILTENTYTKKILEMVKITILTVVDRST